MEIIVLGIVCLSLVGAVVYLQILNADTLKKMKAIEKAKDLREVHEYIMPQEQPTQEIDEDVTISLEDLQADELHKILRGDSGK